jgi:hypothetical protein
LGHLNSIPIFSFFVCSLGRINCTLVFLFLRMFFEPFKVYSRLSLFLASACHVLWC